MPIAEPADLATPSEPADYPSNEHLAPDLFTMPGGFLPPHMIVRSRKPPDIVPGMCFEASVGMIVAPPFVGKTLLLVDLAIALATGQRWLKWTPTRAVPSIVFALDSPGWESREQAENLMAGRGIVPGSQPFFLVTREDAERMHPCGADGSIAHGTLPLGPFDILDERWFNHICQAVRGSGAKLVGLDSLSKIHRRDENDRLDMEAVNQQIARLASATKAHVMILHHTPVIERPGSVHAGRGSGVTAGSVDFEASIVKVSPTDCRFDVLKGRGSDEEGSFIIRKVRIEHPTVPRAVRWEIVPPKPPKPKPAALARAWFEETLAAGPLDRDALIRLSVETGFDEHGGRKVDNYLRAFRSSGLIYSPSRGQYALK